MTSLRQRLIDLANSPASCGATQARHPRMVVARIFKEAGAGAIAERIGAFITQHGLDNPYGGAASRRGRSWDVGFSKPGVVEGTVRVFGDRFIQVKYKTHIRDLPSKDSRVFLTEWDAKMFLELAFVERKYDKALALKTK